MANNTIKTLTIMALAGTSLSGCALIGGAAEGAWSGTKYVAKFVSTPVRALLRDAPKDDVQFAEAVVEVKTVDQTETMTKAAAKADGKIEMMAETVVEVKQSQVLGATSAAMPMNTAMMIPASTDMPTMKTDVNASWTETLSSQAAVEIVETVAVSEFKSVDVVTVGSVSYVRTDGVGSLEDWRTCDIEAGGFWKFDSATADGTLNPKFETCMQTKNYVQETQLDETMMTKLDTAEPATAIKPLP